jgi:predicted metal-binding membrane protein
VTVLAAICATGWLLLLPGERWLLLPGYCAASAGFIAAGLGGMQSALLLNSAGGVFGAWLLMLAAMMPPLLLAPLLYLRERSFAVRRARAAALFLLGYALVWSAAGLFILAAAVGLHAFARGVPLLPAAASVAVALAWHASPARQHCLNRCHDLPALPAFGPAADVGALLFGFRHGAACVGGCWAAMIVPLSLGAGHLPAMLAVAVLLAAERVERARQPRWELHWPRRGLTEWYRLLRTETGAALHARLKRRAA